MSFSEPIGVPSPQPPKDHSYSVSRVVAPSLQTFKSQGAHQVEACAPSELANLEGCEQRIRDWAREESDSRLEIRPIELSDIEDLQKRFLSEGARFRFDWDATSSSALLRMPSQIHSTPLSSWLTKVDPIIQAAITAAALCDWCVLYSTGDANTRLDNNSMLGPDQGLAVHTTGMNPLGQNAQPRVVFECAVSQSTEDVRLKTWRYLYEMKDKLQVHAVVVFDVVNPPSAKNTGPCTFVAEVWVRQPTGDPDKDYPLDECPASEAEGSGSEDGGETVFSASSRSDENHSVDHSTWSVSERTKVEDDPRLYCGPSSTDWIWRRNDEVLVVYDEGAGDQQPPLLDLELDVYDFIRTCNARPWVKVPDDKRLISLPLDRLRNLVQRIVLGTREALRENHKDKPEPSLSAAAQKGSKRSRKGGPSSLQHAKRARPDQPL